MANTQNTSDHSDHQGKVARGSQKDLFSLSIPDIGGGHYLKAIQSLAREGIHVIPAGHNHWIVKGNRPLPEVHCYSEQELQRFARSNARHYLTDTHREKP